MGCGKSGGDDFDRYFVPLRASFLHWCFLSGVQSWYVLGALLALQNQSIEVFVAWERGFSAQTFWNQRQRANTQLKGADSSLKRIGSRFFCLIFIQISTSHIIPPPLRVRLGMYQKSNQPWNHGETAEGHSLGSISYGDYDFQEGVLSSRCFGWTFGPFHQRPPLFVVPWKAEVFFWIKQTRLVRLVVDDFLLGWIDVTKMYENRLFGNWS